MNRLFSTIKQFGSRVGLDIRRVENNPSYTYLGLRHHPFKSIIDIGANLGQSAKEYRTVFPEAHVYCFEPIPDVYQSLSAWASTQNGMVTTFNLALGEQTTTSQINLHTNHSSSSSILSATEKNLELFPFISNQNRFDIQIERLDDIFAEIEWQPDLLVKIDVQGFEDQVILGGVQTLQSAAACIVEVNIADLYEGQPTFKTILERFYDLGFQYGGNIAQSYHPEGHCLFFDALFLKQP